jgi:hypothetical protein
MDGILMDAQQSGDRHTKRSEKGKVTLQIELIKGWGDSKKRQEKAKKPLGTASYKLYYVNYKIRASRVGAEPPLKVRHPLSF